MTEFAVGTQCVYPGHGVVEIVGEETKTIGEHEISVFVLKKCGSETTIIVPKTKAETVGVRPVVTEEEIEEIFSVLTDRSVKPSTQTWNRRQREYVEKLNTGCLFEVAEVIRDLQLKRMGKPLSFGERELLEQAKKMLIAELAVASEKSATTISSKIDGLFTQAAA